ncbi:MAG: phage terminase large subunit [Alphaproteobacteria bacterium]
MITQSWDTAMKSGAANDASACATFFVRDGMHHLIDMLVVRLEYPALKRCIISQAAKFHPEAILLEDKASGQSLLQDLRLETELPLLAIEPKGDKLARLIRITPLLEAGKVALPRYAPWLADFETELCQFPNVAHDDQVDAFSQYLNWIRNRERGGQGRIRRV